MNGFTPGRSQEQFGSVTVDAANANAATNDMTDLFIRRPPP